MTLADSSMSRSKEWLQERNDETCFPRGKKSIVRAAIGVEEWYCKTSRKRAARDEIGESRANSCLLRGRLI